MARKINHLLTEQFLREEYGNKKKSALQIAKEANVAICSVHKYINAFRIAHHFTNECENLAGMQFGEWTVLPVTTKAKENRLWLCKCTCGKECNVAAGSLKKGGSTQCKSCAAKSCAAKRLETLEEFRDRHMCYLKHSAKKRGHVFQLDKIYLYDLFLSQGRKCALSGMSIKLAKSDKEIRYGLGTASLDRIDSDIGYVTGNVQWVHKDINRMKQRFNQQYFVELCSKVYHSCTKKYKENTNVECTNISSGGQDA